MRTIAWLLRAVLIVAEKLFSELALLAAIFSTTHGGSYLDRILGGMYENFSALYGFAHAHVTNMTFANFVVALGDAFEDGLETMQINVQDSPRQVLLAMVATYAAWKVIAYLLRLIRKNVLRGKKGEAGTVKSPGRTGTTGKSGGGKTYEQLYRQDQPPARTPPEV